MKNRRPEGDASGRLSFLAGVLGRPVEYQAGGLLGVLLPEFAHPAPEELLGAGHGFDRLAVGAQVRRLVLEVVAVTGVRLQRMEAFRVGEAQTGVGGPQY